MKERFFRIESGIGGDCTLILGSEKTAVVDCGMAYAGPVLVRMLKEKLNGRKLDYLLATHTHYDHIGAMGYLRGEWPKLLAAGNEHAQMILQRPNALKAIRKRSETAGRQFGDPQNPLSPYRDEDLRIDRVLQDGERISLGDLTVQALETPGHTNCSLSYYVEEERLLFTSESIGCYYGGGHMGTVVLTGMDKAFASIEKCRSLHPEKIIGPHHGLIEEITPEEYFDMAEAKAQEIHDFAVEMIRKGMTIEEMTEKVKERYWIGKNKEGQPEEAFEVNAAAMLSNVMKDFEKKR